MNARRTGFTLVELLVVIAILGLLAALIVPAVTYAMFQANKGICQHQMKAMTKVPEALHTLPDSPIGDKWIEGKALDNAAEPPVFDQTEGLDSITKSRLAFWRMVADPAIREQQVSPGGTTVFHCPGAGGDKQTANIGTMDEPNSDFAQGGGTDEDIRKQLFYSMFCQEDSLGPIIPQYGTNPQFVIMGDRNPIDDDRDPTAQQRDTEHLINSQNHVWGTEGSGQTICYSSGTVAFKEAPNVGIDEDEIYLVGKDTAPTASSLAVDDEDTVLMQVEASTT